MGDGIFTIALKIEQLIMLQERLGVGPEALLNRLLNGEYLIEDIPQVIRLALIGGGMSQRDSYEFITRNVKEGYLAEYKPIAVAALHAALVGVEDDPYPEDEGEAPEEDQDEETQKKS